MKGLILNRRRATRRTDNIASGLILRSKDGPVADSRPPSDFPLVNVQLQSSSPRLRYILYSTSTAPLSTIETVDLEPSLGATGRAVSIGVVVTLLVFFCVGVASYFCWRERTRFYKQKGQVLQIWNTHQSRKQPFSQASAFSTASEAGNSVRPTSKPCNDVTTPNNAMETTRSTQDSKIKTATFLPTWKFSRTFNLPSRPVTAPPTAMTANRRVSAGTSTPPVLLPTTVPSTLTMAGYVPDPVIGAYMDNARRQYAAHLAKTGNYPPHYLNPITAPNLLAPTVPTPSSQHKEDSEVSSLSSTTFGSLNKKPKSVWERTSDLVSNRHFRGRRGSHVSKNHVSRFFQENARPHSHPLYAPRYDSDEEGDEDEREEEEGGEGDFDLGERAVDKEGRAYRHPNDFMVRTPMTVQEAQAAAARMQSLGEERKRKMGISVSDATLQPLPPPLPAAATQTTRF